MPWFHYSFLPKRRYQTRRFVSILLGAALIAGLFAADSTEAAPKLRIGAHRALMGSFEIVAHRKGFWKEQGLYCTIGNYKQAS